MHEHVAAGAAQPSGKHALSVGSAFNASKARRRWTHMKVRRTPFLLSIFGFHIIIIMQRFGSGGDAMRQELPCIRMSIVEDGRVYIRVVAEGRRRGGRWVAGGPFKAQHHRPLREGENNPPPEERAQSVAVLRRHDVAEVNGASKKVRFINLGAALSNRYFFWKR
jgi:hypothetical protein